MPTLARVADDDAAAKPSLARRCGGSARRVAPWCLFYAATFALLYGSYWSIERRVALGRRQQASVDALEADPAAFVWYTLELPDKASAKQPAPTDDDRETVKAVVSRWRDRAKRPAPAPPAAEGTHDDFAALFLEAYGAWMSSLDAAAAARLLRRHCGSREFVWIVKKQKNEAACGGALPREPAACRSGYYADDDGRGRVCPDGAFCPNGQTCFVL